MDNILNAIWFHVFHYYRFFVMTFVLLFIVSAIVLFTCRKFSLHVKSLKIYGVLFNLSNINIFKLTLIFIQYCFILSNLILIGNIGFPVLAFLMANTIIFYALHLDINGLILGSINQVAIFFAMMMQDTFIKYLSNVYFDTTVFLLTILLTIFIILYSTYLLVYQFNKLLDHNIIKGSE